MILELKKVLLNYNTGFILKKNGVNTIYMINTLTLTKQSKT